MLYDKNGQLVPLIDVDDRETMLRQLQMADFPAVQSSIQYPFTCRHVVMSAQLETGLQYRHVQVCLVVLEGQLHLWWQTMSATSMLLVQEHSHVSDWFGPCVQGKNLDRQQI